ncbi:MAG: helix-turn-helix transcriptional regulator [Oscillospiraceae bacterium]|nr:helix-turn-helix transcriptional regulator [Oscillospiraceae bacterium]
MELSGQIKKYRTALKLSQEQLAEKVYVTRQTISNWENDKSYPDIHSLILLSNVFDISLDELIKGDKEIMKEEINREEIRKLNEMSTVSGILTVICLLAPIPLIKFFGIWGMIIYGVIFGCTFAYMLKIEKLKKKHDISTYKEIIAFLNGERLDEISKAREEGKRPYQNVLKALVSGIIMVIVCIIMAAVFDFKGF